MNTQTTDARHQAFTPDRYQVERAARAWQEWQFPGRDWDTAPESMKNRFREGARHALVAAFSGD